MNRGMERAAVAEKHIKEWENEREKSVDILSQCDKMCANGWKIDTETQAFNPEWTETAASPLLWDSDGD